MNAFLKDQHNMFPINDNKNVSCQEFLNKMKNTEEKIQAMLFELQDIKYKDFQAKLIPTVNPDTVIGVRTPMLRKLAKEISKTPDAEYFLKVLPHKYYEENNLHGFLIEAIKDYDMVVRLLDDFLPHVDNWATCDMMSPKVFKKHPTELLVKIKEWIKSDKTYTVRFGIGMLMNHFLDENFKEEYLTIAASVKSEEYYINMMLAWYFATALAKQYNTALPFIEQKRLDTWTHNKAIQKAVESSRVSSEQKVYLKTLKIK